MLNLYSSAEAHEATQHFLDSYFNNENNVERVRDYVTMVVEPEYKGLRRTTNNWRNGFVLVLIENECVGASPIRTSMLCSPACCFSAKNKKQIFEQKQKTNNIKYLDEPYTRFKDKKEEQETFFIKDPHGNVLELKTLKN